MQTHARHTSERMYLCMYAARAQPAEHNTNTYIYIYTYACAHIQLVHRAAQVRLLNNVGYCVHMCVVDSSEHGTPQKRKRLYLLCMQEARLQAGLHVQTGRVKVDALARGCYRHVHVTNSEHMRL